MHDAKEKSDATVRPYAGAGLMYAEVILPLPLGATFTYRIPQELDGKVSIGSRIIVPFGRKSCIQPSYAVFRPSRRKICR